MVGRRTSLQFIKKCMHNKGASSEIWSCPGSKVPKSGTHWSRMWRSSEAVASLCDLSVSLPLWSPSTPGTLAQPFTAAVPRDAASYPQTRGLPVSRKASEPSIPRSRAQRHPSSRDSPLRQRAPNFCLQRTLAAEMGEWMRLGWPGPGVARLPGLKIQTDEKRVLYPLGYKISYRLVIDKFEITDSVDKRKKNIENHHC